MKTIEIGPEQKVIGRVEGMDMAMPGQLRIPKDIAIANHIAQFWNDDRHPPLSNSVKPTKEKREILSEKKKEEIAKEKLGITNAIIETTVVMSDALQIKLEDVRDGISAEVDRRLKKWMKENGYLEPAPRTGKWNDI